MNGLLRTRIMASTLTLFSMLSVEQIYTKEVRSPCVLTVSEKVLVDELTRFSSSAYLATQANIKKCIVLGATTIVIHYENGRTGLFSTGETIHLDSRQEKMEPHDTKMSDTLHDVPDQKISQDEAGKLYNEFVFVWNSVRSPDDLTQENLVYADTLVKKLLSVVPENDQLIVSVLGSRGNRYLTLIEQHDALSTEALLAFYGSYLGTSHYINVYARMEDIPTDDDKRVVVQEVINILETRKPFQGVFPSVHMSNQIKKFDPDAYARLIKSEIIQAGDE